MMIPENELKQNPYGVANFNIFRESNYYYVDKTHFIPVIEKKGRYLFLIRPRRFGKSLFLAVLEAYYDIEYKNQFDSFFSGTAIHQNPADGAWPTATLSKTHEAHTLFFTTLF